MRQLCTALAATLLVVGCTKIDPDPKAVQVEAEEPRAWAADGVDKIWIESVSGNIAVTAAGDADSITADITRYATGEDSADALAWLDSVAVKDESNGGELEIECQFPSDFQGHNLGAAFQMSSPAGKSLRLELTNGDIDIDGMAAGAELDCVNSNVSIVGLQGGALVEAVNGDVDCDLAALAAPESAVLSTVNGNLVLSLPAGVSATFDAQTGTGSVAVTGFGDVSYTTNEDRHKAGTIGGGGATVDLDGVNGNVTIRAR